MLRSFFQCTFKLIISLFHTMEYIVLFATLGAIPVSAYAGIEAYQSLVEPMNKLGFSVMRDQHQLDKNNIVLSPYSVLKQRVMFVGLLETGQQQQVLQALGISAGNALSVSQQFKAVVQPETGFDSLHAGSWLLTHAALGDVPFMSVKAQYPIVQYQWPPIDTMVSAVNKEVANFISVPDPVAMQPVDVDQHFLLGELEAFRVKTTWKKKFTPVPEIMFFDDGVHKRRKAAMALQAQVGHGHIEGWQGVSIPCEDASLSLWIIMPDNPQIVFDAQVFSSFKGAMVQEELRLVVPLFQHAQRFFDPKVAMTPGMPTSLVFANDALAQVNQLKAYHYTGIAVGVQGINVW